MVSSTSLPKATKNRSVVTTSLPKAAAKALAPQQQSGATTFLLSGCYRPALETRSGTSDVLVASYAFDGNSLRVVKVAGADRTFYLYAGTQLISEYEDAASNNYNPGTTPGAAPSDALATKLYQHADHLTTRLTTENDGDLSNEQAHYPYGESWYESGQANPSVLRKYTSYLREDEASTGRLNYAVFREHSARIGRFHMADPVQGGTGNPQRLNRYAYVTNDPGNIADPTGLDYFGIGGGWSVDQVHPLWVLNPESTPWGGIGFPGSSEFGLGGWARGNIYEECEKDYNRCMWRANNEKQGCLFAISLERRDCESLCESVIAVWVVMHPNEGVPTSVRAFVFTCKAGCGLVYIGNDRECGATFQSRAAGCVAEKVACMYKKFFGI